MNKPNFFIAGAPKCGTTAMHDYLRQHPDIFMPVEKEPSYFHVDHPSPQFQRYRGNLQKYLALFDDATSERMIGEASPGYFYSDQSAREIYEFAPDAKIILMLREPVDMLNSLYQHQLYMGDVAGESLESVLQNELESPEQSNDTAHGYLPRVQYTSHVKRYIDTFGRSQVHIILFDDVRSDLHGTYRQVLEFLNVDPTFVPEFKIVNSSKVVRDTPIHQLMGLFGITPQALRDSKVFQKITGLLPPSIYRRLIGIGISFYSRPQRKNTIAPDVIQQIHEYLKSDIVSLSQLIDRDLNQWLTDSPVYVSDNEA